ncbi:murein biosynthesis integral membrane protein MurJ [Clostridium perfringens]|uniref:murein biosynthesis integral membrane protein MurJ n=1 Tax=Clostridium perfringens TaxID=1502 RepID=UPI0018E435BA|nr:murein biosynthesis integral membrane protein MurJ [Clostridium perfringens]MBI6020473.1 murein biosynthesis integral membrane protein MurJ [Clostridium perfringens]MDH2340207.1 murein biosynthesis integral membrane protein MurJ [Clostridium perfringens]HDI3015352.1 murein biosynthesis integral membrane protein MurJ [Clostridium perfringens]
MSKKYSKIVTILFIITILSKITGMLRESFIASAFGTSYKVDAYNIAYIIPFLLFSLIGPAITTTFIPILSETYEQNGKNAMYKLANNVISIIIVITMVTFLFGQIFPNVFVDILAPSFNNQTKQLAIELTRISIINVLFIGINYGFMAILNVLGEFTSTGISGLLLNLPIIVYVLIANRYSINQLMFFTMIGYGMQIVAHIPFLIKHKYKYKINIDLRDSRIKKMLILIIPIIIGIGVNQVNVIIDRMMASGLQEGTIAAMGYANKTNEILYTLFTGSVMVVIFPMMSKDANKGDNYRTFKENILKVEKMTMFIIIPATLFLAYLRKDVITILFKYGQFNNQALEYTSIALFYLSFSTIFYALRDVYNKGLLALQDTKTSVINTSFGMLINILINLLTVKSLGIVGLCLATSISSLITCFLLRRSLYKRINIKSSKREVLSIIKILGNCIITLIIMNILNTNIHNLLGKDINSVIKVFINSLSGVFIYIFISYITKTPELIYIFNEIKIKIKKKNKSGVTKILDCDIETKSASNESSYFENL